METKDASSTNHLPNVDCGFAGTLKNIQLNDLIQIFCLSASSLCMQVTKDNRQGKIFIVDGEIVHATCENMAGEEAFFRIMGWQTGSFESIEMSTIPQRTIQKNYHFLIIEAARRLDEKVQPEPKPSRPLPALSENAANDQLRVLIVDDSPMMRKILFSILNASNRFNVVGMACNGKDAISLIDDLSPDLVTLDVNMPVMDGISTIKHIMIKKPCPVVIMSNPGDGSAKTIFNFLELGAVDFISKPIKSQDILIRQQKIFERIRIAATAKISNFRIARIAKANNGNTLCGASDSICRRLVIVIAGPGGHPEQMSLLSGLMPAMADIDGAVVALQNLPPTFCDAFAQYLSERCGCPASPINRKTPLSAGRCYVGIHGCPLIMKVSGRQPVIDPNGPGNGRASLDQFLLTAASVFKQRLAVVLLSGANTGEQSGIRAVHENGGQIILRNRLTSLVAEPLDQVVEAGLADEEVNPADLVKTIVTGFVPKN